MLYKLSAKQYSNFYSGKQTKNNNHFCLPCKNPISFKNNLLADTFALNYFPKEQDGVTSRQKLEFCRKIIEEHNQQNISLPNNSKFKIEEQIADPFELMRILETLKTPYDTEEIVIQRAKNLVAGKLKIQGNKKMFGLKNHPVIGPILKNATAKIGNADKGKKIVVITGNSASGKSTYCKENGLAEKQGYFLVDSDEIKKMLPYYYELGNNFTHDVSALVACAELTLAMEQDCNIVFPTTGIGKVAIELALKNGYEIEFLCCNTPTKECIKRSIDRFKAEKRFVDPNYIIENSKNIENIRNLAEQYGLTLSIVTL